ncbi:MAG: CcoQ/FixQ family Cbb3-type cytochrome c oxidase assembly chaperone [Chitinophagales bacterium]|nr:CcoQ/FixQ family Cbb3-type cytochrome c oxidase assembly chaperone [Chitinophagales bacterium]
MKFSTYLENITGVSVYPLISLVIFVAFFLLVLFWMYSIDGKEMKRIENLPFDDQKN